MDTKLFKFKTKWDNVPKAYIVEKTYSNPSNLCLEIHDFTMGHALLIATTNVAGHTCPPGHVLIKNWSENEGVYEALLAAGVIGPVKKHIGTGFVTAYECEYLKGK